VVARTGEFVQALAVTELPRMPRGECSIVPPGTSGRRSFLNVFAAIALEVARFGTMRKCLKKASNRTSGGGLRSIS
jgi:hypothetical protein